MLSHREIEFQRIKTYEDKRCVFIGGCGRSGTTMLGSALGAASNAIVTPESQFKLWLIDHEKLNKLPKSTEDIFKLVAADDRFRVLWEMPLNSSNEKIKNLVGPERVKRIILEIVDQYAKSRENFNWDVWIDHSPNNIRNVTDLLDTFPRSKFINLIRDGRAVASSVLPLDWGPVDTSQAADWWIEAIAFGLAAERRYPDQFLQVRYEALTQEPEATLKRICAFIGVDFVGSMVNASALKKPSYIARQHARVGTTINSEKNEAWRQELTKNQVERFEFKARELLNLLGYTPVTSGNSARVSRWEFACLRLLSVIKKWDKKRRFRRRVSLALAQLADSKSKTT